MQRKDVSILVPRAIILVLAGERAQDQLDAKIFIFHVFFIGKQQLLSIGDNVGTLRIMEVPWNLRRPSVNEVHITIVLILGVASVI